MGPLTMGPCRKPLALLCLLVCVLGILCSLLLNVIPSNTHDTSRAFSSSIRTMTGYVNTTAIRVEQFGDPDVMKLTELNLTAPDINEVLIRIHAAGVNPADTYIRSGVYANLPSLPYTPGGDCAGIVEAVGSSVKRFNVGDRVAAIKAPGSYARHVVINENNVYPLHSSLSFQQGAALSVPYFTAYRALFTRGQGKAGETVLVNGASGGVGIACIQLAVSAGMTVIGTAGTDAGLSLVKQQGAKASVSYKDEQFIDKIMEATDSRGPDIVIEMLANINLQTDLQIIAPNGRILIVGNRGEITINPRLTMQKESSVLGVMMGRQTDEEKNQVMKALYDGSEQGWLRPVIAKEYPLDSAPQAHIDVIKGPALGKLVLII